MHRGTVFRHGAVIGPIDAHERHLTSESAAPDTPGLCPTRAQWRFTEGVGVSSECLHLIAEGPTYQDLFASGPQRSRPDPGDTTKQT